MKLTPKNKKKLASKKWRMHNLYKVVNKKGDLVVFQPNFAQDMFMRTRAKRNIILKSRQLGFTTLAAIDFLDDCLFNKYMNAVIIAHEEKQLEVIFSKIQLAWTKFYEEFGQHFGYVADTSRSNILKFNNGSTIRVALSSRGDMVQRLHISEFGKICAKYPQKAEEIVTGSFPSVPADGKITIESTADGESGYFHDMFWEAWDLKEVTNTMQFKAFFVPWFTFEEYSNDDENISIPGNFLEYQKKHRLKEGQIRWYYLMWRTLKEKMKQEFPTTPEEAFESGGSKIFNNDKLNYQLENFGSDGEPSAAWTFYELYKPGHVYGLGADPAEGIGRDSSTAQIIDFSHREFGRLVPKVVATFASNTIPPDIFAFELKRGASLYGNALAGVERNGNGLATLTALKGIYSNIYIEHRKSGVTDQPTKRLGFLSTASSKPMIIFNLSTAVNEDDIIIPDKATIREMKMFDETNLKTVKYDETQTRHLDRVSALAIAYEMRNFIGPEADFMNEDGEVVSDAAEDPHAGIEI